MMEKIKTALCIKDGFMKSGRIFCFKNNYYKFHFTSTATHGYNVKTENNDHYNHSMTEEFFDEYFIETEMPKIETSLPEELFEV